MDKNQEELLDEILLNLSERVEQESAVLPGEPDRILEGFVRFNRDGMFVMICQELRLSPEEIKLLSGKVKWR